MIYKIFDIYRTFLKIDFKRVWLYKFNVIAGNLGFLLDSLSELFVIFMITSFNGGLAHWSTSDIVLIYLFMNAVTAVWEVFFVTTLDIPDLIQSGELDIYLMRPLNPLFQIIMIEIDEEALAEMVIYVMSFFVMLYLKTMSFSSILLALILLLTTLFLVEGVYLTISSMAFWLKNSDGLRSIYWRLMGMSDYPLSIYPKTVQILLTVIPVGFMAYYPVDILLHQHSILYIISIILAGPFFFALSYFIVWKVGLKHYSSFG